ncbi:MAG: tetratricopeptide repeat protein, partial [Bacteroidota bacterium]
AVLSSIYGVKMAYSPWKGIFLGGKSSNLMKDAIALSKESALVWKLYANSKLYTPQSFGGDKKEAAKGYEKAIALFEKDPASADKNWIYLDALAHLGITYMQLEKNDKARETFERALEVEPEFNWVKYILLPQLDKS